MVEFTHRSPEPAELIAFRLANPTAGSDDFESLAFLPVKVSVKQKLNQDQGGLCAYCESVLSPTAGQVDHVKSKSAHPDLIFAYDNYVQSCIHPEHCGQEKGSRKIFIEPGPSGCNESFTLSTRGSIGLPLGLSGEKRIQAGKTLNRLRLDYSALRLERERWIKSSLTLFQASAGDFEAFIADKPFRFILRRLIT